MEVKALNFLKNPQEYLQSIVELSGYDTCHRIQEIDASLCAKDCKKLSNSAFAR